MKNPYKTILIDDEPPARERLFRLLADFSEEFDVIDIAKNGTEAVEKINQKNPDLIFLDIEMPGLNGFQVLEKLEEIPLVIFCTAYDTYSLKAFETNSLDYLLKPVRKERLAKTVKKLEQMNKRLSKASLRDFIKQLNIADDQRKPTTLTVKHKDQMLFIKLDEILYFESKDKYVNVFTGNTHYLTEQSLSALEKKLPAEFIRIHRSLIINKAQVASVERYFNSRYLFRLKNNSSTRITSGRSFKKAVELWLYE